jgi:thiamine phosphate synthase YjbQ (UPF0047 family)
VTLGRKKRGCHLVQREVLDVIQPSLSGFKVGLCHVFLQHTSASITINEVRALHPSKLISETC